MIVFGIVSESFHHSRSSVVAALVPSAHKTANRSRDSTDEVSKVRGESSRPNPEENRAFALAAVRHQKSSKLISGQEKTQSDVPSQENPGHASGDRLHRPDTTRNPEGKETVSTVHRLPQNAAGR